MNFILSFLFFISINHQSFALIVDVDNRVDYFSFSSEIKEVAQASIALIPKKHLKQLANGDYVVVGRTLQSIFNMCTDAKFSFEKVIVNCSASLISRDILLTAAHCIDQNDKNLDKDSYYAVFDYKRTSDNQDDIFIKLENVYSLEKELYHNFDLSFKTGMDLALYKLNKATLRKPLIVNLEELFVGDAISILGYPLGIPMKFADDSLITKINKKENSFRHFLDTFSVNSGSPILNDRHEVIGVHVRGTGWNVHKYGRECGEWMISNKEKDYSEANYLASIKGVLKNLNIPFIE